MVPPSTMGAPEPAATRTSVLVRVWRRVHRFLVQRARSILFFRPVQPPAKKNNYICTSKYTPLSFIPKCLAYQFSRSANIYFFCIGILQLFPQFSSSNGVPTVFFPLTIVILVSSIKELVEDLGRHRYGRRFALFAARAGVAVSPPVLPRRRSSAAVTRQSERERLSVPVARRTSRFHRTETGASARNGRCLC